MAELTTWLTGFGLAGGAGAKAFVPLLVLGGFHYTPYFELSGRFEWIASPEVMAVMGVLLVLEILVDSVPELAEYADIVAYLPKAVAGFLAFAAATGTVDEDLAALTGSGLLGAGTAVGTHWLRNRIRRPFRRTAESVHEGVAKVATLGEVGGSAVMAGSAVLVPPAGAVMLLGAVGLGLVAARGVSRRGGACPMCGARVRPDALVCPGCGRDLDSRS